MMVLTAFDARRGQYDIGIGYADDIEAAREAILDAVRKTDGVLSDPEPDALVVELAGSTVNVRARWWTKPQRAEVVQVADRVITNVKQRLDQEQIDMPYPTNVVLFHDQTEETDGDRTRQREGWPAGDDPPKPRTIASELHRSRQERDSQNGAHDHPENGRDSGNSTGAEDSALRATASVNSM